ncbi:MAG: amidase [Acidobacteria bacterium]|nr:amidase [Acidobacteriota bacterium]MXZ70747.1 amidase [Acidobacteriota bacterium]MYJ03421.1 amidase [Acidobacteriota bacterium]
MSASRTARRRAGGASGGTLGAAVLVLLLPGSGLAQSAAGQPDGFRLEESTIESIHTAIREGQISCQGLVQAYIDRARAYNGACTRLVTLDGGPIEPASGPVRAGAPVSFPTSTVPVSSVLPDFDRYSGLPLDLGRMEPTISDPAVQAQYGMVAGVRNAGQVNALSTLNLRGERSVTCKAGCDAHPSTGAMPANCPAACERFRQQPDALERAAELDAQYGDDPDLAELPMYCVPFAFKDVYDTRDMRTTTGADINFAMDAPPADSTIVERLREKGAIIYAKANATEFNGGIGNPGGAATPAARYLGYDERSTWGGQACNPYDTERSPRGSSSGSGVAVSANLATCAFCEQTGGSCKGPASRNAVVSLLTTKGLIPYGGAVGSNPLVDRAGINCRTVKDAALVLDALADPELGYFDPRDIYTALPEALTSGEPYARHVVEEAPRDGEEPPLAGMRIGIVREYMVKHTQNDAAISDQIDGEIKAVLRDRLGASLVESVDPLYPDDPGVPNMAYAFQDALAEILPIHMPEYFFTATGDGELEFAVPGHDVTSPRYLVDLAEGNAPLAPNLNLRRVTLSPATRAFAFHIDQYLARRGDARVTDRASLDANTKYFAAADEAGSANWAALDDVRSDGNTERMKMRAVMQLVLAKVMRENRLDVLVNPENTLPHQKVGGPSEPTVNGRGPSGATQTITALIGAPEIAVPAGFNEVVYEPRFVLNEAGDRYREAIGDVPSRLETPLPISMMFWAGPGAEAAVLKAASAYEAATRHRMPPPDFGPLRDEP